VSPGRLQKRLARSLVVSWREQPTRYDIEALQANIRRVGLVIRVRWMLLFVLAFYSVVGGFLYTRHIAISELVSLMMVPALALGFVVLYNTFYSLNYRRLGNIAVWNNLQLGLDALVVTVLVYFSGGVNSWFWTMYALFILEAAAILPRSRDAWLHAVFSCLLLGLIEWAEFVGFLEHKVIPFTSSDFYQNVVFVGVRYLWQVTVLLGMATVSTLIIGTLRKELASRLSQRIVDDATGLYSRQYFTKALAAEARRAQRDVRPLHVLLIDVDRFGEFNERFGIDAGDRMIVALAQMMAKAVVPTGERTETGNLVARYGGEEFCVLLSEVADQGEPFTRDSALAFAERIRESAAKATVDDACVTVSIGLASYPADGHTPDELLDAADAALSCAIEMGGNRVVSTTDCAGAAAGRTLAT
jgi:diguanylate cyclase (GGDEF)-like protein